MQRTVLCALNASVEARIGSALDRRFTRSVCEHARAAELHCMHYNCNVEQSPSCDNPSYW